MLFFVPFCSQTFVFIIMFATDLPIKVLCLTYFTWKFARRIRKGVKRRALFSVVVRTSNIFFTYTVLQKYAQIVLKQNLLRSTTLDIITRLLDNAAFVCVHVVGRFSKDFSEVCALRSRGFQLQVEWRTTVLCAEL